MLLRSRRQARRLVVLGLPLLAIAGLILGPLLITLAVSFFEKQGFGVRPAFTLESYRLFFTGVRLEVSRTTRVTGTESRCGVRSRGNEKYSMPW